MCALFASVPAAASCPLELVPAEAPAAWRTAAQAATQRLAASGSHDCGSVEIAVRPTGGALVTFITTDGRRAVRALLAPEELAPTLDALLVTLPPDPPAPEPAPAAPAPTVDAAAPPEPMRAPAPTTRPTTAAPEVHFILGGAVGLRMGFGGVYATPDAALRASGTFGAWELGAIAEYAPYYAYLPGGTPSGFWLWSFIAGVQAGRRESLGNWNLGYGLGFGVASVHEEADDTDGSGKVADYGQPRTATYVRLSFPRRARWRGVVELTLDAVLGSVKKRATVRNDVPDLPRFGATLNLGIEALAL